MSADARAGGACTGTLPRLGVRYQTGYNLCNLDCPYCFADWQSKRRGIDGDRLRAITRGIERLPYAIQLRLGIGGEAFTSKDILEEVVRLSHAHGNVRTISFSSNVQADWERTIAPFLDAVDTSRLGMGCTLHDSVIEDVDLFFQKVAWIRDAGVEVYVGYVAIPERIDDIRRYEARCADLGVPLFLNPYGAPEDDEQGSRVHVPHAYTAEEKAALRELYAEPHQFQLGIEAYSTFGMRCSAGAGFVHIDPRGEVYPCSEIPSSLGNVIEGDVALRTRDVTCPARHCWCPNQNQALRIVDRHYARDGRTPRYVRARVPREQLFHGYNESALATASRVVRSPGALGGLVRKGGRRIARALATARR